MCLATGVTRDCEPNMSTYLEATVCAPKEQEHGMDQAFLPLLKYVEALGKSTKGALKSTHGRKAQNLRAAPEGERLTVWFFSEKGKRLGLKELNFCSLKRPIYIF